MTNLKKVLSLILCTSMLASMFSFNAFAEDVAYICDKEEHVHIEGVCYVQTQICEIPEETLICSLHEHEDTCYVLHEHSEACFEACAVENVIHEHSETCYAEHTHEETCFEKTQVCTGEEPVLTCEIKEDHVHGETCYTAHVCGDACYEQKLVCEGMVLDCEDKAAIHEHTDACCNLNDKKVLICLNTDDHVHEDACYEVHEHEETCFDLEGLCELEEHLHDEECVAPEISMFAASSSSLTIASQQKQALAPGVTETEVVAYDKNGDRIVYYVVNANIATNDDVMVKANYHDNDNTGNWGKATVVEQANAATAKRGYNVVATTNAAYYNVSTGQPSGAFVMEGVNVNGDSTGNGYPFFAIMKDGSAMIGDKGEFSKYSANIQEAVGGWSKLVWDGEIVTTGNSKYPRSTVGIKANGDVVLMLADGNQKPYSAGMTYQEQAEVMLELGCVRALELDGGGSATYAAKPEGTDEVVLRSSPCDGTIRSVSNSLMVISTAEATGEFHHANLSTEFPFYAPTSAVEITAYGADAAGHAAEIPEDVEWELEDEDFGYVEDGIFYSDGKLGKVTVNMLYEGEIVGSVDVTLVHPTEIAFGAEDKMIPYGKPSDFTVTALYNGADMYAAADVFEFNCTAGSMDGFIYTAPEAGDATAEVTVSYLYDTSVDTDKISITFGKGSDILFDFEGEGDADVWGTYFDMVEAEKNGEYDNGYTVIYASEGATSGNLVEHGIHENVFLASRENGDPVYSGDHSLAYTVDYRYSTAHANWQYAYLYYWGEPITLLDTSEGIAGTRLGMWMYIPEEAVGSCARFAYTYKDNTTGALNTAYLYLTYQYVEKGFSKLTSDKIPEAGWAYVYVDMSQISNSYVSTSYYKDANGNLSREAASNYAPAFIQFIVSSSATGAEKVTFYIDDITLDYSDAVDDRDMPIISDPMILEDQDQFEIKGQTLNYDTITVTASAKEDTSRGTNYTGLDESTAQVYIDGHAVGTKFAAGKISATGIKLPNGTHDITFEIADKQGNYTKLTRQIVIEADNEAPEVALVGKPVGIKADGKLYTGGQYDIQLSTDKVEGIDSVSFQLWLNSASEWALEHMTVLDGFEVDYELNELSCTADITVTRVASDAEGEAVLLTIPVYAWSWNEELGHNSASYQWNHQGCAPQTTVSYKVKYGSVEYTEDQNVDVAGFSNKRVDAKTELDSSIANLKPSIGAWHYHSEIAVADQAATCTQDGFTGRTECSVCHSILNWGTTLTATGHTYAVVGDKLTCTCGDTFTGTGLIEVNGDFYYAIAGTLQKNRWIQVDDAWYCFRNDFKAYTGDVSISGRLYHFGENGAITEGQWFDVDGYHRYYIGPNYYRSHWGLTIEKIDGVEYGFDENGDTVEGYIYNILAAGDPKRLFLFDEDGVRLDVPTEPTIIVLDGTYRYINNAELQTDSGLVKVGESYYYVRGNGNLVSGRYYISASKSNGYGFVGYYDFDADYKLIMKNGIIDGHYYIDGIMQTNIGLVKIEDSYYYVKGNGNLATGHYCISASKSNGYGFVGYYDFAEDGKLIMKNGIVDGNYYIDGVKQTNIGLVKVEGAYYYVKGNGNLAIGRYYINEAKSNGLGFVGYYDFAEDGKLIMKNGIVDGSYYINGVKQTNLGLILIKGEYYYVKGNGNLVTGRYYISATKSNDLGFVGYYDFAEDGKLIMKNGIVDGSYYIDGVKQTNIGLVKVEGAYYYVKGNGNLATGRYYISETKSNGLGFVGYYEFAEDGKLTLKTGIIDGHYYIDGVMQTNLGIVEVEGNYYYVKGNGNLVIGRYYVSEAKSGGLGEGYYEFDEAGKMIVQ